VRLQVRFKTLATLHLLVPHLDDACVFEPSFVTSIFRALHASLADLASAIAAQDSAAARPNPSDDLSAVGATHEPGAAFCGAGGAGAAVPPPDAHESAASSRSPVGRKPLALTLAEEALTMLHALTKRLAASGQLAVTGGLGTTLLCMAVGLSGTM
jgi:hypothetical protein